jgi:hypothetical protein
MKKLFALAACAALISGCDFAGGSTAEPAAVVSSLTINSMSLPTDSDNTAPDLYVEIQDAGGRALYKAPAIRENVTEADFPYTVDTELEVYGEARSHYVVLMDQTDDGYELIAISPAFTGDALRAVADSSSFQIQTADMDVQLALSR